jgi:hypothetical protein
MAMMAAFQKSLSFANFSTDTVPAPDRRSVRTSQFAAAGRGELQMGAFAATRACVWVIPLPVIISGAIRVWDSLNSQLAVPGLGLAPYCAPLDVRRVAGGFAGDRAPLVLGNQARLEQLETVEEAEDLVPAPWPDPLAGSLIHRHRFG